MRKQQKLKAKLRFNEYKGKAEDSYKSNLFEDVFAFSTGMNIKQAEASPDFATPCVRYGELYHMYNEVITTVINRTNIDPSELKFSDGDEILLPSAGEDPLDIGSACALTIKGVAIGRTINILKPKKANVYDQRFASYYINQKLRKKISTLARGASISNVYNSDLKQLEIILPTLPEQRKIADFLTAVDGRIQQLSQKLALLQDYKKGVMQQLFTQVLRFKDDHGNDFPDWEEKRVEEMFQVTRGKVLAMPETHSQRSPEFQYPVYSSQTSNNGLAGYYDTFLFRDAITWTTDGANAGDVKFRKGEFYCTNVCGVLLSDNGYANEFVAAMLGTVTRKHVSYVGNPKLMNNVMSQISISVPSSLSEQTKIANFLTALDRKIESVSQQIALTQTFKRGLLQQMFV